MQKFLLVSAVALPLMVGQTVFAQSGDQGAAGSAPDVSPSTQPSAQSKTQASPASPNAQETNPATPGSETSQAGKSSPPATSGSASGNTGNMGAATPGGAIGGVSVKDGLLGKTVYNAQDEKVGEINDIVLARDGRTAYYIIGAGGFIGMGEHDVAIESSKVSSNGDKLLLQGYTKDQLEEMPEYQPGNK